MKLIESIKVQSQKIYELELHNERILRSSRELWGCDIQLDAANLPLPNDDALYKLRVIYDARGVSEATLEPYKIRRIKSAKIINGQGVNYVHKSTDREPLKRLLEIAGCTPCQEIIICTPDGEVQDTTYTNLVFEDSPGGLFTPLNPLLRGVRREALLRDGKIKERKIMAAEVNHYSRVYLINAMIGLEDEVAVEVESDNL